LTEVRAGLATFFAMAYIISVNATITMNSGKLDLQKYKQMPKLSASDLMQE
jgi:xanthine/uracil/vitamin C permease (AzgA family)